MIVRHRLNHGTPSYIRSRNIDRSMISTFGFEKLHHFMKSHHIRSNLISDFRCTYHRTTSTVPKNRNFSFMKLHHFMISHQIRSNLISDLRCMYHRATSQKCYESHQIRSNLIADFRCMYHRATSTVT